MLLPMTRKRFARRITEGDTIVIDGVAQRVQAVESVGYGAEPDQTTLYTPMGVHHFWWDDRVDVVVTR
jgi:hypothetical protein